MGLTDADRELFSRVEVMRDLEPTVSEMRARHEEKRELWAAQEVVSAIGLGYTRHHRRDPYGNESRYRGFVHIRTASGLNETVSGADDLRRIRPLYDVCFVTG